MNPRQPVTREEIAEALRVCFTKGQTRRTDLLLAVQHGNARPELIETLERLPDRTFAGMRDLWVAMPEVPLRSDHAHSVTRNR